VGTAYRERVSWLVSAVYISLSLSLSWTLLIGLPSFLLPFYLWFETKMFFIFAKTKTSENYVLFAKFRSEKIIFQTFSFCECFREKKILFYAKSFVFATVFAKTSSLAYFDNKFPSKFLFFQEANQFFAEFSRKSKTNIFVSTLIIFTFSFYCNSLPYP
jgi:hypothetical protein